MTGVARDLVADYPRTARPPQATESINKIAAVISPAQIEEFYVPLLKRLSTGEWFTSRTSAAALYASVYPKASAGTQDELRKLYTALSGDDTPMVRRAAARHLAVSLQNASLTWVRRRC